MTKQELRIEIKKKLKNTNYSVSKLEHPELTKASVILSYLPLSDEVDITKALSLYKDKIILYPVIKGDEMYFTASPQFKKNHYGILEPINPNEVLYDKAVMLVPGLLFDNTKHRLGRGKGYYDKYIKAHREKLYTIGVLRECQLVKLLPFEDHDEVLDDLLIL